MVDFNDTAAFNRYIAAGSVYTTPTLLRHLAQDKDARIRRRVAGNPNIPRDLVDKLVHDNDIDVRIALTENPAIASEYMELFVHDSCADVRFAIAENPLTPGEELLRLATDENPYVAMRARKTYSRVNPHTLHELAEIVAPAHLARRDVS